MSTALANKLWSSADDDRRRADVLVDGTNDPAARVARIGPWRSQDMRTACVRHMRTAHPAPNSCLALKIPTRAKTRPCGTPRPLRLATARSAMLAAACRADQWAPARPHHRTIMSERMQQLLQHVQNCNDPICRLSLLHSQWGEQLQLRRRSLATRTCRCSTTCESRTPRSALQPGPTSLGGPITPAGSRLQTMRRRMSNWRRLPTFAASSAPLSPPTSPTTPRPSTRPAPIRREAMRCS